MIDILLQYLVVIFLIGLLIAIIVVINIGLLELIGWFDSDIWWTYRWNHDYWFIKLLAMLFLNIPTYIVILLIIKEFT